MNSADYCHDQNVLCETDWVERNLNNTEIKILEVDYDVDNAYNVGHIPGADIINWKIDINDEIRRDIINKHQFESLMSKLGISKDDVLVLYGDFYNWFAAFAFWVFKYYGHNKIKLINGGRKKWELENRSYTTKKPFHSTSNYISTPPNQGLRAYLHDIKRSLEKNETILVDVRSVKEYQGEISTPPEYPMEQAQRSGHIPTAINIPWIQSLKEDGTFKNKKDLEKLYLDHGITPDKEIISYCRIGERSSHTWFVLKYLLGYPSVRNYDGSWAEWGNMVGNPVEK
ncbi:MAG: sulfurtransferase [Nitrososphaeraceae archaeon]